MTDSLVFKSLNASEAQALHLLHVQALIDRNNLARVLIDLLNEPSPTTRQAAIVTLLSLKNRKE